jgi:hypothetical protein
LSSSVWQSKVLSNQTPLIDQLSGILPDKAVAVLRQLLGAKDTTVQHSGQIVLQRGRRPDQKNAEWAEFWVAPGADARFRGRALGTIKWAVVVAEWEERTNKKTKRRELWVKARGCTTHDGNEKKGGRFEIRLEVTGDAIPNLLIGDVLAYRYDADGVRSAPCSCECVAYSGVALDFPLLPPTFSEAVPNIDVVDRATARREICLLCEQMDKRPQYEGCKYCPEGQRNAYWLWWMHGGACPLENWTQ